MRPDIQQNMFYTLYFLILHNILPIMFLGGLLLATAWALYKPARKAIFLMIGCALLLFSFEYSKHIVEGLKEQTLNSVITETPHDKLERLITVTLSKILPLVLNITGVAALLVGVFLTSKEHTSKH
jgi:hypothetical protein